MGDDVELSCRCGKVRLLARDLTPESTNRVTCGCRYCVAYARLLDAPEVLNSMQEAQVFQLSPARLQVSAGEAHVACLRLSRRGVLRWYARCCDTPLFNTLPSMKIPFVGVVHGALVAPEHLDRFEKALGPVRARVNTKHTGSSARELHAGLGALLAMLGHVLLLLVRWKLRGDGRQFPLFDAQNGMPKRPVERRTVAL